MIGKKERAAFERGELALILGDGIRARTLSLALLVFRGMSTVICDSQKSPWGRLLPVGAFHEMSRSAEPRLLSTELSDMAAMTDALLYLVAQSAEYARMTETVREELECRFIISDAKDIMKR